MFVWGWAFQWHIIIKKSGFRFFQMAKLLETLLKASEKAASIARAWRCQSELFHLLVEEKLGEAKNERFVRDFKTLADVLVQEVVKYDLTKQFPELKGHIHGEESNKFTNNVGQEIKLEVQDNVEATTQLLTKVLDGKLQVAQQLADLVHSDVAMATDMSEVAREVTVPVENLAVWIDPIDGTAQYLKDTISCDTNGLISGGLPCATVLIGVYDRTGGNPVAGVINQPFADSSEDSNGNKTWTGQRIWGIVSGEKRFKSCYPKDSLPEQVLDQKNVFKVAISESEGSELKDCLLACGAVLCKLGGVGYKLLKVIDHTVNFYFLSKCSCFKWDTCAAHAVLCSMGGGVVPFHEALHISAQMDGTEDEFIAKMKAIELVYHRPDREDLEPGKKWSNSGGLIAFRSYYDLLNLLRAMR